MTFYLMVLFFLNKFVIVTNWNVRYLFRSGHNYVLVIKGPSKGKQPFADATLFYFTKNLQTLKRADSSDIKIQKYGFVHGQIFN